MFLSLVRQLLLKGPTLSQQFSTCSDDPVKTSTVNVGDRYFLQLQRLWFETQTDRTEFWKAVQSSWKTEELGVSSSLHFFLIDWSVVEKSDTYLHIVKGKYHTNVIF